MGFLRVVRAGPNTDGIDGSYPEMKAAPGTEPEISMQLLQLQKIDAMSTEDRSGSGSIILRKDGRRPSATPVIGNNLKYRDLAALMIEELFFRIDWRKICLS
jgi:hypothetical protein